MSKSQLEKQVMKVVKSYACRFVPQSKSRNAGNALTLNFICTIAGLDVEYSAGAGHCANQTNKQATLRECEGEPSAFDAPRTYEPSVMDVAHSLRLDACVLDHDDFAGWAQEYGYNSDSIADQKVYQACRSQAEAFRSIIGQAGLDALHQLLDQY